MGRQLVSFGLVGAVYTAVSLVLFGLLRAPLGVAGATVVALGATAFGNLWANRRWTFGRRDATGRLRYYARSGLVLAVGMTDQHRPADRGRRGRRRPGRRAGHAVPDVVTHHAGPLPAAAVLGLPGPRPVMSTTASAARVQSNGAAIRGVFGRMARCLSVSVLTTLLSLVTLALLVGWWGTTSWVANMHRRPRSGPSPPTSSTAAGCGGGTARATSGGRWSRSRALSFSGLVLSTAAVATADAWASSIGLVGPTRTAVLLLANVGSFAVLWAGQFLVLDRVLFGPTRRGSGHRRLDRLPVAGGEVGLEGVVDRPPVVHRLRPAELEQPGELLPAAHQVP